MNKRVFSLIMIGVLAAGLLVGCGSNSEDTKNDHTVQAEQTTDERKLEEEPDTLENVAAKDGGVEETESSEAEEKTIVVYFSATGNTEQVASVIAEATGGELFQLEPVEPYTDEDLDWTDKNSRVGKEHEDPGQREIELVSTTIDGWGSASVVYVGYPLWWGIAAWPVNSFVKANDFAGKTVIPFCTSASSGLGESGELLAELAGSGEWKEGMRFPSNASDEEVQKWVDGLGL
ncbi:MAG: flavodoxin [Lachnospiraceae bacterium]|nr:flavodoxin [Lachnospiraceae bacterium]